MPYSTREKQQAYNIRKNLERRITPYISPTIRENKQRVKEIKENTPCEDCHQCFPAICMDFDHVEFGCKVEEVSRLVANGCTWDIVAAEINKCEIVCANCHRLRSQKAYYNRPRRGAWPIS